MFNATDVFILKNIKFLSFRKPFLTVPCRKKHIWIFRAENMTNIKSWHSAACFYEPDPILRRGRTKFMVIFGKFKRLYLRVVVVKIELSRLLHGVN